ncbi:MAG: type II secretion system protein [Patescibacteria group bacterium]|nr:type II secretion system protein [Patescibacteria group bacterium]
MFMRLNVKMNKGFTLIEFLVSITIIGILTAMFIPSYLKFQTHLSLQRSAIKLAQDVKVAQEMAIAAAECPKCPSGEASNTGYGVYFDMGWDNKQYRLYADTANSDEFFTNGADTVLDTMELEDKIFIEDIDGDKFAGIVSINFKPPDPGTKINDNSSDLDDTVITLCIQGSDCTKANNIMEIKVNTAGLIYVE